MRHGASLPASASPTCTHPPIHHPPTHLADFDIAFKTEDKLSAVTAIIADKTGKMLPQTPSIETNIRDVSITANEQ
jgi:hypothetical protein